MLAECHTCSSFGQNISTDWY